MLLLWLLGSTSATGIDVAAVYLTGWFDSDCPNTLCAPPPNADWAGGRLREENIAINVESSNAEVSGANPEEGASSGRRSKIKPGEDALCRNEVKPTAATLRH